MLAQSIAKQVFFIANSKLLVRFYELATPWRPLHTMVGPARLASWTPTPTTKEKNHKAEIGPTCKEGMWKLPSSENRSFSLPPFLDFMVYSAD
jgi:hypothetical protein